jgi:hypothetical protein
MRSYSINRTFSLAEATFLFHCAPSRGGAGRRRAQIEQQALVQYIRCQLAVKT